jgi:hypothetical protein
MGVSCHFHGKPLEYRRILSFNHKPHQIPAPPTTTTNFYSSAVSSHSSISRTPMGDTAAPWWAQRCIRSPSVMDVLRDDRIGRGWKYALRVGMVRFHPRIEILTNSPTSMTSSQLLFCGCVFPPFTFLFPERRGVDIPPSANATVDRSGRSG